MQIKKGSKEVVFTFQTEEDAMKFIRQVDNDKFPDHRWRRGNFQKFYSKLQWAKRFNFSVKITS